MNNSNIYHNQKISDISNSIIKKKNLEIIKKKYLILKYLKFKKKV